MSFRWEGLPGSMFRGGCAISMAPDTLSDDAWCCIPILLIVCSEVSGACSCWVGTGLDAKIVTFGSAYANQYSEAFATSVPQPHSPLVGHSLSPPPWATLPSLVGRFGPDSYGISALYLVLVHMYPCVHPPRVEFLFPSVLWSSFT